MDPLDAKILSGNVLSCAKEVRDFWYGISFADGETNKITKTHRVEKPIKSSFLLESETLTKTRAEYFRA